MGTTLPATVDEIKARAKAARASVKSGWQTTEFWVAVAAGTWAVLENAIPATARAVVVGVATAAYSIARAITKAKGDRR